MSVPFPHATPAEIEERYSAEHRLFYETLEALHALAERLDERPLGGMTRVQFFTLFQFVKALKTAQAFGNLFFGGFGEDAEVLLRVLVEQAIIVRWVHHSDSDDRARAYALFLSEKQFGRLQFARKFMPRADLSRVPVSEIESAHTEYATLDKALKWRRLTADIERLAADVGMDQSYAIHFYGTDFVHSNPTIEPSYVRTAEGATWFNTTATMPPGALSLPVAAHHLLVIADVFNNVFDLDANELLRRLMDGVKGHPNPPTGDAGDGRTQ